jgi:glycosyltransferase involved in cell wall biosynthesis
MGKQYSIEKNKLWDSKENSYFSVITPIYNRKHVLNRPFDSIKKQTYTDFEYIIIDDGSTDSPDGLIKEFLEDVEFPVLYIKKKNGGVHTARNIGIKYARGVLLAFLDSDDELTENALELAKNEWESIPPKERLDYFQIKGRCVDENGKIVGSLYPDDINEREWHERVKIARAINGEQVGIRSTEIMKENLWPEPVGVNFVTENVMWAVLDQKYKSHYFNEVLNVYHCDGDDHLSGMNKKRREYSNQKCRNILWENWYYITHRNIYIKTNKEYVKRIIVFSIMKVALNYYKDDFYIDYKLNKIVDVLLQLIFIPPSILYFFLNLGCFTFDK